MWGYVDLVLTDVSEERIFSIFRVESDSEEPVRASGSRRNVFTESLLAMDVYSDFTVPDFGVMSQYLERWDL
jgi:hypothetical protein